MTILKVGDRAPGFGLPDADQELVHLSEFKDEKILVLYFYPKDDTPGCTIEAQDFTALRDDFAALDTVVIGVSRDDCGSHAAFKEKYGLGIQLLADTQGDVCEKYGVWQEKQSGGKSSMGIVRSTFIIDRTAIIRHALYGVEARGHAQQVLQLVKDLHAAG